MATNVACDPSRHPADHDDTGHFERGHLHGCRIGEDPASVQPAHLPDSRRPVDVPLPRWPSVEELLVRCGNRAVRVRDRLDAHSVVKRDLKASGGSKPVVTVDSAASKSRPRRHADTRGYKVFRVVNVTVLILVMITMLYPFLMIVAQSFSSDTAIRSGHVSIFPVGFNLTTYRLVMGDATFWTDYRNTVVYTAVATLIAIVLTTCYAYVISKKHLRGRGVMIGIAVFTMFFNGGLIPNYILITSIGFRNTIWAIVLPNAISVFN